ncbi:hypothetical protein H0E87_008802 [Populus deltoides]|uniref:C-JID domain-containing protein n=1 Tax=Populus deltoides TaxID=3696 RepID=A0A8T2Z1F1_POPDE|nr:hypothetical protein H0E87_008802 [Populus deltoides]
MSLKLSWNHFERIPANIKQLSKLIKVVLDGFKRLRRLLELNPPSLQVLIASDCVSLESVASVSIQGEKEYEAASQQFNFEYLGKPIRVCLCVLGSEVPEWFSYKSTEGSSVKIKLPAHRNHTNSTDQFSGFTFCAVVSFGPCQNDGDFDIRCECHLITKGGVQSDLIFNNKGDEEKRLSPLKREHEFLKGA